MIPMQITYTEYQRAEQPIADFITHLLLVIKKIASPFVLEYRQWIKESGIEVKCTYPLAMMQFLTAAVSHLDNPPNIYHDRVVLFQIHAPSNTSLTVVSQTTSGNPEFFVLIIGR